MILIGVSMNTLRGGRVQDTADGEFSANDDNEDEDEDDDEEEEEEDGNKQAGGEVLLSRTRASIGY
jgi:hypothetical protein